MLNTDTLPQGTTTQFRKRADNHRREQERLGGSARGAYAARQGM